MPPDLTNDDKTILVEPGLKTIPGERSAALAKRRALAFLGERDASK